MSVPGVALVADAGAAEPEVLAAARIDAEVDDLVVDARAQARRAELAVPVLRDVEAQQRAARAVPPLRPRQLEARCAR